MLNASVSRVLRQNSRAILTAFGSVQTRSPFLNSDTRSTSANYLLLRYKVPVLVVMECKRASVFYVYELIFLFLLHTSRSTEYISLKKEMVSFPELFQSLFYTIC